MSLMDTILNLTKRLYPTGRAFRVKKDSFLEKIHKAINEYEKQAFEGALSTLDSILADNENFTLQDASDWERRLAIRASSTTSLEDRKLAILRKYSSPGDILARQHFLYLEGQLQAAGFDAYVHEFNSANVPGSFLGDFQLGENQLGASFLNTYEILANRVDYVGDQNFQLPPSTKTIFYIAAENFSGPVNIPTDRREEFRQLILQIKPAQTVGLLFINYT